MNRFLRRQKVNYKALKDLDLIKFCGEGNQSACKELYERYIGYCYTICVRYGIPEIEIKDMLQVIFSEIFKSLHKYDQSKAAFKTWMTRVTINQVIMRLRKTTVYFDQIEEDKSIFMSDYANYGQKIDEEFILKTIANMPAQYLVVFNMSVIDGYSHQEISQKNRDI